MLLISLAASFGLKSRLPPRKAGPIADWAAFKEPTYVLFCIGMFLTFWSLYFAFYYVGSFARDRVGFSYEDSINLIILINGVGIPGRLIPALVSDHFLGPLNSMIPTVLIAAVMLYSWAAVHSSAGVYAFAAIYGLPSAGIQTLWPATLSSLTSDPKKMGTRIGMGFSIGSFASLTGSPLGGALVSVDKGRYLDAQI